MKDPKKTGAAANVKAGGGGGGGGGGGANQAKKQAGQAKVPKVPKFDAKKKNKTKKSKSSKGTKSSKYGKHHSRRTGNSTSRKTSLTHRTQHHTHTQHPTHHTNNNNKKKMTGKTKTGHHHHSSRSATATTHKVLEKTKSIYTKRVSASDIEMPNSKVKVFTPRTFSQKHCHRNCGWEAKKHKKHTFKKITAKKKVHFKAKGKDPPWKDSEDHLDPALYAPRQITTFYRIPNKYFKNEQDVARYNEYELNYDNQIGQGGFATVITAKNLRSKEKCACKIVELGTGSRFQRHLEEMKVELLFMEFINNPFAIQVYLHYLVNEKLFIYMLLADGGSLRKYLEEQVTLTEKEGKYFFAMMCAAVEYLHNCCVAHRDIKPDNFLISNNNNNQRNKQRDKQQQPKQKILMICDYGLSCFVHRDENGEFEKFDSQCGTPAFMAPEMLAAEQPFDAFLTDNWALGVSLYMMMCGTVPFDYHKEDYGYYDMLQGNWYYTHEMKAEPTKELNSLLCSLLEPDPGKRARLKQVVNHVWVKNDYAAVKSMEKMLAKNSHSSLNVTKNKSSGRTVTSSSKTRNKSSRSIHHNKTRKKTK